MFIESIEPNVIHIALDAIEADLIAVALVEARANRIDPDDEVEPCYLETAAELLGLASQDAQRLFEQQPQ